jgi:hypothetical protein
MRAEKFLMSSQNSWKEHMACTASFGRLSSCEKENGIFTDSGPRFACAVWQRTPLASGIDREREKDGFLREGQYESSRDVDKRWNVGANIPELTPGYIDA